MLRRVYARDVGDAAAEVVAELEVSVDEVQGDEVADVPVSRLPRLTAVQEQSWERRERTGASGEVPGCRRKYWGVRGSYAGQRPSLTTVRVMLVSSQS